MFIGCAYFSLRIAGVYLKVAENFSVFCPSTIPAATELPLPRTSFMIHKAIAKRCGAHGNTSYGCSNK
jgi:hypothetical protein